MRKSADRKPAEIQSASGEIDRTPTRNNEALGISKSIVPSGYQQIIEKWLKTALNSCYGRTKVNID